MALDPAKRQNHIVMDDGELHSYNIQGTEMTDRTRDRWFAADVAILNAGDTITFTGAQIESAPQFRQLGYGEASGPIQIAFDQRQLEGGNSISICDVKASEKAPFSIKFSLEAQNPQGSMVSAGDFEYMFQSQKEMQDFLNANPPKPLIQGVSILSNDPNATSPLLQQNEALLTTANINNAIAQNGVETLVGRGVTADGKVSTWGEGSIIHAYQDGRLPDAQGKSQIAAPDMNNDSYVATLMKNSGITTLLYGIGAGSIVQLVHNFAGEAPAATAAQGQDAAAQTTDTKTQTADGKPAADATKDKPADVADAGHTDKPAKTTAKVDEKKTAKSDAGKDKAEGKETAATGTHTADGHKPAAPKPRNYEPFNPEIQELQEVLVAMGLLKDADGLNGELTKAALKKFAKLNHIETTDFSNKAVLANADFVAKIRDSAPEGETQLAKTNAESIISDTAQVLKTKADETVWKTLDVTPENTQLLKNTAHAYKAAIEAGIPVALGEPTQNLITAYTAKGHGPAVQNAFGFDDAHMADYYTKAGTTPPAKETLAVNTQKPTRAPEPAPVISDADITKSYEQNPYATVQTLGYETVERANAATKEQATSVTMNAEKPLVNTPNLDAKPAAETLAINTRSMDTVEGIGASLKGMGASGVSTVKTTGFTPGANVQIGSALGVSA